MYKNRFVTMFPEEEIHNGEAPFYSKFKEKFKHTPQVAVRPPETDVLERDRLMEDIRRRARNLPPGGPLPRMRIR